MSKHMLMLKDASLYEIIGFLDSADQHGHSIPTQIGPQVSSYGRPNDASLLCTWAFLGRILRHETILKANLHRYQLGPMTKSLVEAIMLHNSNILILTLYMILLLKVLWRSSLSKISAVRPFRFTSFSSSHVAIFKSAKLPLLYIALQSTRYWW